MDIITEVATGLVNLLISPFLLHLSYLVHYKRNIDELKTEMEKLRKVRMDVLQFVEIDERRGRVTKEVVKIWLVRVDAADHEVLGLNAELEANKGCLTCNVHYRVGKVSKRKICEVKNLQSEGQFGVVSIPPPPPPGIEFMDTPDFQLYAPTKLAMEQIVEALEDKKLNLIGVYGMGGVGKTTLVQKTAKHLKNKGVFDPIVVVTVSQKCILTEIQREIAEKLGFPLEEVNESARASRLLQKLEKEKRILIVLDDLWEPLELTKVGIPYIHGDKLDGKGNNGDGRECRCSIIITTRSLVLEVCNQMQTQSTMEVKVLPEADAWQLFRRSVGGRVDSPELYFVAAEVVTGCGGLPVALVTLGRALRDKDLLIWQNVASQLKRSRVSPSTIPGMEERVFSSIKLSYDYLISKEAKLCFLLCCLFPEDHVIEEDELFPFVWGEEVLEDTETLRGARERLHLVLDALKRSCLLINVEDEFRSGVRMHDIVRDVAIWIASQEEHGFVVNARGGLDQWPDLKKRSKRLSLMENRITRLPEQITGCPQLTTLSLRRQEDPGLQDIPGECFEGMKSVKVPDLNFNRNLSTSSSAAFSCLKELRVLLLDGNGVEDISLLGNMKNLEILSLSDCWLMSLPQEMISGGMTNLRSLNLSRNSNLIIPSGVVSRLCRLEELNLLCSFKGWEAEDGPIITGGAAHLSELASLPSLNMLKIEVPNINSGAVPLVSNLSRFCIWLGEIPDQSWEWDGLLRYCTPGS